MKHIRRTKKSGYTLVEVLLVAGIMTFIGAGAMAIMVSSISCFNNTSTKTYTDMDAVMAMQMIVQDVREARNIKILANGNRLRVIFPKMTDQGYYDRTQANTADQIDYYLSDETGVPGHDGDWLWRGKNDNNREPLKKGIVGLSFEDETESMNSVKITIIAENKTSSKTMQTRLTQRIVYLRNYCND